MAVASLKHTPRVAAGTPGTARAGPRTRPGGSEVPIAPTTAASAHPQTGPKLGKLRYAY